MKNTHSTFISTLAVGVGVACLFGAATGLSAQNIALWTDALPGHRKALDTSKLAEKMFAMKIEVISIPQSGGETVDSTIKEFVDKVKTLTVTGVIWSEKASERRVLMGDIVMHEGQAIPAYVFDDGRFYVLVQIGKSRLRFRLQDSEVETPEAGANPVSFEVPFGLKDPLKNESSFSSTGTSAKDAKK